MLSLTAKFLTLTVLFHQTDMDKKDIIIYAAIVVVLGVNYYLRYKKKKAKEVNKTGKESGSPGDISGQSDDYEPYSGKN